jgi:transposase InsO family protein
MLEHRRHLVEIIDESVASGARLRKACEVVSIDPSTYRRWQGSEGVREDQRPVAARPEPTNKLSIEEREQLLAVFHRPEFRSLPPSQVVPMLADQGIYLASESTCYRVLHEAGEQHDRGRARVRQTRAKPSEYRTTGPNQAWSWDVTWLKGPARGLFFYLYMIVDIFSRKIVGWEVYERECGELASCLVRRTVLAESCLGTPEILHADNGSPQKSSTLRAMLQQLGIEPSYSRPRTSNDNAYSEALFRTTKYRPDFPADGFATLEQAREWVLSFVRWYNLEHRHSGIRFVTPDERHQGMDIAILKAREAVYETARAVNPERWSGKTRNWSHADCVVLNPDLESVNHSVPEVCPSAV